MSKQVNDILSKMEGKQLTLHMNILNDNILIDREGLIQFLDLFLETAREQARSPHTRVLSFDLDDLQEHLAYLMVRDLLRDWALEEVQDLFFDQSCTWANCASFPEKEELLVKIERDINLRRK